MLVPQDDPQSLAAHDPIQRGLVLMQPGFGVQGVLGVLSWVRVLFSSAKGSVQPVKAKIAAIAVAKKLMLSLFFICLTL